MEFYQNLDSRIIYYKRPKNRKKGANACRNYGFERCKGEYVNWFDDDDLMHPKKLEVQKVALSESDFPFCVCKAVTFKNSRKNIEGLRFMRQNSATPFQDYLEMNIGWMTPSVLWRKKTLENLKYLFDEDLRAAQEWEFHSRVLAQYPNYHSLEESLDFIRKHNQSITYQENEKERSWHYFLARLKIYRNKNLKYGVQADNFLKKYLLNSFKKLIRSRSPYVFNAFVKFIIPENRMTFSIKFYAFLSIISYRIIGKGNNIHQKIRF